MNNSKEFLNSLTRWYLYHKDYLASQSYDDKPVITREMISDYVNSILANK